MQLHSLGRCHSLGSPEQRATAGWWHLLGSGRWIWEAARQRALAVTKFPRTAGRIAPLPTTRDRLGKSSGILNWG